MTGITLSFDSLKQNKYLSPLGLKNPSKSDKKSSSSLRFPFNVNDKDITEIQLIIKNSQRTLVKKKLPEKYHSIGAHEWEWDGFDDQNILDTSELKRGNLTFALDIKKKVGAEKVQKDFYFASSHVSWVDTRIDKGSKRIDVTLRLNIKNGGSRGVNEMPPKGAQETLEYINSDKNDVKRKRHVRTLTFESLRSLVLSGVTRYWSRFITVGGQKYDLIVKPVNATENAMDDIKVIYNTNHKWARSSNPGSVKGYRSFFANAFVGEKIAYNVGWQDVGEWIYYNSSLANNDFQITAAHEIGHEILGAAKGDVYSFAHKGTSTLLTQRTKPLSKGGESFPKVGNIDLMKYFVGAYPPDYYGRACAAEIDVKFLVWLSGIKYVY